ncbi:MAG: glycosyltransferase family 2 protein [Proteobacteria bacterium]|nr:glycosyltransferase family 2 protein [Pseudomonadota bacterium]
MKPLVSIIVPVYNRIEYIGEAIESVLAQTYGNYEIVIIDDGSVVDISGVLSSFQDKIHYVVQGHKGLAVARNNGIHHSTGEYLVFLDDDDLLEPKKLEIQVDELEKRPDAGFVFSDAYYFDDRDPSNLSLNPASGRDKRSDDFAEAIFFDPNVKFSAVMFRRHCFDKAGFFDEYLAQHEDGDILLRVALCLPTVFSSYPSARIRQHRHNMSSNLVALYRSVLESGQKITNSHPEFKARLGSRANERFAEIHFQLGKAYIRNGMLKKAFIQFLESRRLSKKFVNPYRIFSRLSRRFMPCIEKFRKTGNLPKPVD